MKNKKSLLDWRFITTEQNDIARYSNFGLEASEYLMLEALMSGVIYTEEFIGESAVMIRLMDIINEIEFRKTLNTEML